MTITNKYNFQGIEVSANGYYNILEQTNGLTVINQGNVGVWVNQVYLNASPLNVNPGDRFGGESLAIGGNAGEIVAGRLQISFDPGTEPRVIIIQKYYLPH